MTTILNRPPTFGDIEQIRWIRRMEKLKSLSDGQTIDYDMDHSLNICECCGQETEELSSVSIFFKCLVCKKRHVIKTDYYGSTAETKETKFRCGCSYEYSTENGVKLLYK